MSSVWVARRQPPSLQDGACGCWAWHKAATQEVRGVQGPLPEPGPGPQGDTPLGSQPEGLRVGGPLLSVPHAQATVGCSASGTGRVCGAGPQSLADLWEHDGSTLPSSAPLCRQWGAALPQHNPAENNPLSSWKALAPCYSTHTPRGLAPRPPLPEASQDSLAETHLALFKTSSPLPVYLWTLLLCPLHDGSQGPLLQPWGNFPEDRPQVMTP